MTNGNVRLRIYLILFAAVLVLGTVGFMAAENLGLEDAIYFTIVTMATVGYGDIHPATPLGKGLAIVLIVTGVGTFLGVVANATEIFLNRRDQQARLQKLQMIVGLFFSEMGTGLLRRFAGADRQARTAGAALRVREHWAERDFQRALEELKAYRFDVDAHRIDLEELSRFLSNHGNLLVRLLESPYTLEHESFTDLLIAVLHFKEELLHRQDFQGLPETDLQHLQGDIHRVYQLLVRQWLVYLRHLQTEYPFLFSLAVRTNPFDPEATPVVR